MEDKNVASSKMEKLGLAEETVGRLYEVYAEAIPEHESFWRGLALEEADHARSVFELVDRAEDGEIEFQSENVPDGYIDRFTGLLEELSKNTQDITFVKALENALEIEKTLAERRFYRSFGGGSPEVRAILDYLDSSSESHVKAVELELERYKTG